MVVFRPIHISFVGHNLHSRLAVEKKQISPNDIIGRTNTEPILIAIGNAISFI